MVNYGADNQYISYSEIGSEYSIERLSYVGILHDSRSLFTFSIEYRIHSNNL